MYGTQDASHIWEKDYNEILETGGFRRGRANGAIYYKEATDTRLMVYGDDFLGLGDDEGLDELEQILKAKYDIKVVGTLGPDDKDSKQLVVLNRTLSFVTIDGVEAMTQDTLIASFVTWDCRMRRVLPLHNCERLCQMCRSTSHCQFCRLTSIRCSDQC